MKLKKKRSLYGERRSRKSVPELSSICCLAIHDRAISFGQNGINSAEQNDSEYYPMKTFVNDREPPKDSDVAGTFGLIVY